MNVNIVHYETIDSTNIEVRRYSKAGAESGLVVTSRKQTAGKGRRGRSWESPADENLYFSILLRPKLAPEKAPMLTLLMAYSVAKALQKKNINIEIKWPNDLVLSKKKICGILTEMNLAEGQVEDVIVGVGLNVNTMRFSEELDDKATSLIIELGRKLECGELLGWILEEFEERYHQFLEVQDLSFLHEDYNGMLINRNREVLVLEPGNEYQAEALGINELGELLVKKADGSIEAVFAGEVSVRGIYGYV